MQVPGNRKLRRFLLTCAVGYCPDTGMKGEGGQGFEIKVSGSRMQTRLRNIRIAC